MTTPYFDLVERLSDREFPFPTLTLQLFFIGYLLLGQLLLLRVWRMLGAPRAEPSRARNVSFGLFLLLGQVVLLVCWPMLAGAWLGADPILLADLIVTVHLGIVLGVLLTLVLTLIGWPLGWSWIRSFWFRMAQLLTVEIVAGQAIVGIECPFTTIERHLRGGPGYLHELENASALGRFCNEFLYYDLPRPVLMGIYIVVALLVLSTWVLVPPRFPWSSALQPPTR